MKYQVVVDTPKGVIFGKISEPTEEELLEVKDALKRIVKNGDMFTLETQEGQVIMSEQMIQQSLFLIKTVED